MYTFSDWYSYYNVSTFLLLYTKICFMYAYKVYCILKPLYHSQTALIIQASQLLGYACCMIDYKDIGTRIRAVRLQRKMPQDQLAEAVGVGATHFLHGSHDLGGTGKVLALDVLFH